MGTLSAMFILLAVLITVTIGLLATDLTHISSVQSELQRAADAGALAGAQDLASAYNNAISNAIAMTALNLADGKVVSSSTSGTTVTATIIPATPTRFAKVKVTAQMVIHNLLGPIIHQPTQTLQATSIAGASGQISQIHADNLFPLAVSLDAVPAGGTAVRNQHAGDMIVLDITGNGSKNAAWTSFTAGPANANYIDNATASYLNVTPQAPGYIPAVSIGDQINLSNGKIGKIQLSQDPYLGALFKTELILPAISGTAPYNQSRSVDGFVAMHVTAVTATSITGVIDNYQSTGVSGPGVGPPGSSYTLVSPVHLIQ